MIPYTPPKTPDKIPVVDLVASFSGDPKARAAIAWEIHKASRETGFFYVANHGIDQTLVDRAFAESARFFELPVERKTAVGLDNWPCLRGHEAMRAQVLDAGSPADLKESYYVGRELGTDHPYVIQGIYNHGANQWPSELSGFREGIEAYYHPMVTLGRHLMRLVALSLSLDETYFDGPFAEPMATLRLLHYPPHPDDAEANQLGAGAHTDYGAITLLAQDDCGGLEIENAAGEWLLADPIPGTFIINLGDMVKRWTNDVYHSNMHRVLNKAAGCDRYSLALFFSPDYFTQIKCLPSCIGPGETPKHALCTAGEHLAEMVRISYDQDAA